MATAPAPHVGALPALHEDLDVVALRLAVLQWYEAEGRILPFRGATDPWAILVSEAMAQQTQASRAAEAWVGFMEAFPTPAALARAARSDVLRAWRGLGYNRRAIALRAAAIAIVDEHGGRVPDDLDALRRLPGVGPYTARAVAALAFGRPVGPVDTNVRRVLTRLVGLGAAPPSAIQRLADALVDPLRPGDWTHALMDVGAGPCRGPSPDCLVCPLSTWCRTARDETSGPLGAPPASTGSGRRLRETPVPFRSTSRWLRGRIVERLRDAQPGAWTRIDTAIGGHDAVSVATALEGLERDGLVDRHPDDPGLARLPEDDSRTEEAR